MTDTVGVALAGGRSARMGTDKAQVQINGASMLQHVTAALREVCERVLVVGRASGQVRGVDYVPDLGGSYRGPLAGIVAAMAATRSDVIVVATDQPHIRPSTLQHILNLANESPVIPRAQGWDQVTCAWYPVSLLEAFATELEGGGSIRSALEDTPVRTVEESEWRSWGEDGASWRSLDTPEDLG
jgi:molybdopterin-guanine dinucleotide biosynthesis protein A